METTYTLSTEKENRITVESQLVYCLWNQGRAYAGLEAKFEVKTILVGSGAKVRITGRTIKGKKIGKVEGVILNNRVRGNILIPESLSPKDSVYLEVSLPKHGLSGESNIIPVRPVITVSSMRWNKQQVERGEEVMLSCEFTSGVEDGDEVTVAVYEYSLGGYHDLLVTIPTIVKNNRVELNWQFFYQEDTESIPTEDELRKYGKSYRPPEFFFTVIVDNLSIGCNQESGLLEFSDSIELHYCDEEGAAVPGTSYTLTCADGSTRKGTLDDNGCAVINGIPPGKVSVEYQEKS